MTGAANALRADAADEDDTPVQRIVAATAVDGSPLHTAAASSVFNWRGTGAAAAQEPEPTSAPLPPPEEEKPMATIKKKRAARKSSGGSPQLQICSALLQFGTMPREALAAWGEEVGLAAAQISSALNNAKSLGRLIKGDDGYELTEDGRAWLAAAGVEPAPEKSTRRSTRKTAHRRGRTKREKVDTHPAEEETADATFRCAVMSDGCFFISKEGQILELTADEHRQMLHYLERMAEPA